MQSVVGKDFTALGTGRLVKLLDLREVRLVPSFRRGAIELMLLAGQEGKILLGDDGARPLEGIVRGTIWLGSGLSA